MAIIPQIYMVYKQDSPNRDVLIYAMLLYAYRSLYVANWIYRYYNEYFYDSITVVSGVVQLVTYLVYFGVYWVKKDVKEDKDIEKKGLLFPLHI